MSKYFKIDRNSREIIVDKHKSYNVNVDILDLIIDLQLERDKYKNIINELEKILEYEKNDYNGNIDIETHNIDSEFLRGNSWEADYILTKLQELKEGK